MAFRGKTPKEKRGPYANALKLRQCLESTCMYEDGRSL